MCEGRCFKCGEQGHMASAHRQAAAVEEEEVAPIVHEQTAEEVIAKETNPFRKDFQK